MFPLRFRRSATVALAGALALTAAVACSTDTTDGGPTNTAAADAGAFPVTMKHAFGSTTVKSTPKRVVTLGWGVTEAALSVGVVPTAIEYQTYGSTGGVEPWVRTKIKQMGATMPTVLPQSTEAPAYDAIKKADPDLILATSTGITAQQYRQLTRIAPTVAYTGKPYTTPWETNIEQVATALGRRTQGTEVVAGLNKRIAAAAAAHPEFKGKTLAAVWDVGGTFYVYRKVDARVGFVLDLGFTSAPSVDSLANGDQSFFYTLSYEKTAQIDSDVLLTYGDTQKDLDTFLGKSYAKSIPAVKSGAVAAVVGTTDIAAVSPPTALSLPDALPGIVSALAKAVQKVPTS